MTSDCGHAHHSRHGLEGRPLADAMGRIEAHCVAAGERLTDPRRRVMELLLAAGQPVKAYDLMAAFAPGEAQAKPPTVYRALEFLERQGLVHRLTSVNAFVACDREGGHDAAFLICDCCGAAREVEPAAAAGLNRQAGDAGFSIQAVVMEAHGLCADCQRPGR